MFSYIYIYIHCVYIYILYVCVCIEVCVIKKWHDMTTIISSVASLVPATFGRRKKLQPTGTCHGPHHRDGHGKQLHSTGGDSALKWMLLCAEDCQGVTVTWPPYHHHHHHHHHCHNLHQQKHQHQNHPAEGVQMTRPFPNNPPGCEQCFAGRYCFTAAGPIPCAGVRGRQAAPSQWGVAGQESHVPCWRFNRPWEFQRWWIWLLVSDDHGWKGLNHVEPTKRLKNPQHPAAHGQRMDQHLKPRIHSWGDPWLFDSFLFPAQNRKGPHCS